MKEAKIVKRRLEWFTKLPDHERQRNTPRHAAKACRQHLLMPFAPQWIVVAVAFCGENHKVDGHTRDFLWRQGLLEKPTHVQVILYETDDPVEYVRLYLAHNNRYATETANDLAFGRLNGLGLANIHPLLETRASAVARRLMHLRTGLDKLSVEVAIEGLVDWIDEYTWYNKRLHDGDRRPKHAALTAAEMITLRKDGAEKSNDFWDRYWGNQGVEDAAGRMDAVKTFQKIYDRRASDKGPYSNWGTEGALDVGAHALRYYEEWHKGTTFKTVQLVPKQRRKWTFEYVQLAFGRFDLTRGDDDQPLSKNQIPKAKVITDLPWDDIE